MAALSRQCLLASLVKLWCPFHTYLTMYLMWTPVGYPTIEGVQRRYALPLLLAGLFAWPILPRRFARVAPFAAGGATLAIGTVTLMWPESVIQYFYVS
jgi:hypothetical protein